MKKLFAVLGCCLFAATAFAQTPQTKANELTKLVIQAAKKYAEATSCQVQDITPSDVHRLDVDDNAKYIRIGGNSDQWFAVEWVGMIGCGMRGSSGEFDGGYFIVAIDYDGKERKERGTVIPGLSSPVAEYGSGLCATRGEGGDGIITLEEDKTRCVVMQINKKGNWRLVGQRITSVNNPNNYK